MTDQAEIDRLQHAWMLEYCAGRCLHVGCGEKRIHRATNIDPSPTRAQWADHDYDVHFMPAFEDGSFDSVVSSHVLPSLVDPVKALREMARVMRPGGVMAHVVPDHRYAPRRCNERYPFGYQHSSWMGPDDFRSTFVQVWDVLELWELQSFREFDWSFKFVAAKI